MGQPIEPLDWWRTTSNLQHLFLRMKVSLDEIKDKRPTRLDYINPMTESLITIGETIEFINEIQKLQRSFSKENSDLNIEVMTLKLRVAGLEKQNHLLIENATL